MIYTKKDYNTIDEKITYIDLFYSREWKSWGVIKYTKDGFQIGEGTWVHSKKEAMDQKKEFEKEYGITKTKVKKKK